MDLAHRIRRGPALVLGVAAAEPRFHFRFAFAFSPSEVLAHDTVLRLTPEQVSFIHAEVRRIQDGFRMPC
jgi:hypothetical protein